MCYNRIQFFFVLGCCCKLGIHVALMVFCLGNAGVGQVAQVYRRQQCVLPRGIGGLASMYAEENVSTIDRRYDK